MKEKYIKFFKKELVFLLILLVVICFSFGLTYSNFVYNSDSYRAVEMFSSKLNYELSNQTLTIKPGNNLFKINIKSLNDVDTYYKVVYDNDNVNIKFFNNETHIIKANKSVNVSLLVFNKEKDNITVNIDIVGGFITNNYNDINVSKDYHEVKDNVEFGDVITLNNQVYRLLNINNDGSYELLSDTSENELIIEGSNGYNQYISIVNDSIGDIEGSISKRALNIEDIEKYTNGKIIEYGASNYFSDAYYPVLWSMESDSIINNNKQESYYSRSEGTTKGNYEHASSIILKDININGLSFANDKYRSVFTGSNYLIATRYQKANNLTASWGVLSVEGDNIKLNQLFESNMQDSLVKGRIRVLVTISNEIDLFSNSL